MHATSLAQIAGNFASMGHALTAEHVCLLGDAAHGYWLSNRFRCDAWHQRISAHRSAIERCGTRQRMRLWHEIMPTLQEILISEPLTRTIAYLAGQLERRGTDADWGALAHSVLGNHIDARHRCLNLMVFGYGLPVEGAVSLNRLRRLLEFFSDQLLGALPPQSQLDDYAFVPSLVAQTQRTFRCYPITGTLQQMRLVSLTTSVQQQIDSDYQCASANPRLNRCIAEAALAMWPPAAFDSFGIPRGRLQETLALDINQSPITLEDLHQSLAPPFDLLAQHLRIVINTKR